MPVARRPPSIRRYPLFVDLTGRRVVVVGGGRVAERKIRQLLDCRARVTVISPTVTPRLLAWCRNGHIQWRPRRYKRCDLQAAWLVISASDEPTVNRRVARDTARVRTLVNVVDDAARSTAIAPAWFRRGGLVVAFSTGGGSPALARQLRLSLSKDIGRDYAAYVAFLACVRRHIHRRVQDEATRQRLMRRLVRANLLPLISAGRRAALQRRVAGLLGAKPSPSYIINCLTRRRRLRAR
jgi:precorrin-2 dehydrogenase/sirohydrochlorin ferrochelatase